MCELAVPVDRPVQEAKDPPMFSSTPTLAAHLDLIRTAQGRRFGTILADPPWQFQIRTGNVAPRCAAA